jgi:hypothetical protein
MHRISNLIFDAEMELYSQQEFAQHASVYNYASSTASPSAVGITPQCSPTNPQYHSQSQVPQSQLMPSPSCQEQLHEPSSSQLNTLQQYCDMYT